MLNTILPNDKNEMKMFWSEVGWGGVGWGECKVYVYI